MHCQVLFEGSGSVLVSVGVFRCLLTSVGICRRLVLSGDVWGGVCVVYEGMWGIWGVRFVWLLSVHCSVLSEWHSPERQLFSPDFTETSKYKNVISYAKFTELCWFFICFRPSGANYKTQSLGSPCTYLAYQQTEHSQKPCKNLLSTLTWSSWMISKPNFF